MPPTEADSAVHSAFAWWHATSTLGRVRRNLLLCLLGLTGAAWAATVHESLSMGVSIGDAVRGGMSANAMNGMGGMDGLAMAGISAPGWSLAAGTAFVVMWTVMMAAMMLPAAAPMIVTFASVQARRDRSVSIPTGIFVSAYLLVWSAMGVTVFVLVQLGAASWSYLAPMERGTWGPLVLGATLFGAGLYQFTPLKRVCLRHCRSPLAFVANHWHEGMLGAFRMGIAHGAYCVGCCWALFLILVAAGIMSLGWMLLLALVVFIEKVFPHGRYVPAVIGLTFICLGLATAEII